MVHVRHGSLFGIGEILIGLAGKSHFHNMTGEMKDSIFLKSLSKNERKLIKAGEYREKFIQKFELMRLKNNIHMIDADTIKEILGVIDKIEKERLFRGKGGEIMRVAVCRFIESISYSNIPLTKAHHKRFIVKIYLFFF